MKIRIRVKNLVYLVMGITILFLLLNNFILPQVKLYVAEAKINSGKVDDKEDILELLRTTPVKSKKWDLIREYMIEDGTYGKFDIYISPSMYTTPGQIVLDRIRFTPDEKIPFLEDYVQNGPVDGYLGSAAKLLSTLYVKDGKIEEAKEMLLNTSERLYRTDSYQIGELLIERIRLAKNYGQLDEANQFIEELLQEVDTSNSDLDARIAQIRVELMLQQGNVDESLVEVKRAIEDYEKKFEKMKAEIREFDSEYEDSLDNHVYYNHLKLLEQSIETAMQKENAGKLTTVSGEIVRSDGTPVEGVGVFLRDENNVTRSIGTDETYHTITDSEGRYTFEGVFLGNYQIGLGFYYEQISGWNWPVSMDDWIIIDDNDDVTYDIVLHELIELKTPVNQKVITDDVIHFEWEEVEGAAYYRLGFGYEIDGGSIGTGSFIRIEDTKVDISVEDIYNITGGIYYSEEDGVDPVSILSYSNPENRYFWKVEAYDNEGILISKSEGYRLDKETNGNVPFFFLKERELTSADKLLLDRDFEQAIEQYMLDYESNPNDVHSLRMITRLINLKEDGYSSKEEEKAIPYLMELADKSPSSTTSFRLMTYFYESLDWINFNKYFEIYLEQVVELDSYDRSIYASALMKQGKHEEASKQFELAMKRDGSNRFVGHWIANELYQRGISEEVISIAKDYPYLSYGGIEDRQNWLLLVNRLMTESKQYDQYENELKFVLDMYFDGDEEGLTNWSNNTDKIEMKKFVENVIEVR